MTNAETTMQPPAEPGDVSLVIYPNEEEPHLAPQEVYVSLDGETWEEPISWDGVELETVDVRGVPCFKGHLSRAMFLAAAYQTRGHYMDPEDVGHGHARMVRDFKTDTPMLQLEEAGKPGSFPVTYDRRRWEATAPWFGSSAWPDASPLHTWSRSSSRRVEAFGGRYARPVAPWWTAEPVPVVTNCARWTRARSATVAKSSRFRKLPIRRGHLEVLLERLFEGIVWHRLGALDPNRLERARAEAEFEEERVRQGFEPTPTRGHFFENNLGLGHLEQLERIPRGRLDSAATEYHATLLGHPMVLVVDAYKDRERAVTYIKSTLAAETLEPVYWDVRYGQPNQAQYEHLIHKSLHGLAAQFWNLANGQDKHHGFSGGGQHGQG